MFAPDAREGALVVAEDVVEAVLHSDQRLIRLHARFLLHHCAGVIGDFCENCAFLLPRRLEPGERFGKPGKHFLRFALHELADGCPCVCWCCVKERGHRLPDGILQALLPFIFHLLQPLSSQGLRVGVDVPCKLLPRFGRIPSRCRLRHTRIYTPIS